MSDFASVFVPIFSMLLAFGIVLIVEKGYDWEVALAFKNKRIWIENRYFNSNPFVDTEYNIYLVTDYKSNKLKDCYLKFYCGTIDSNGNIKWNFTQAQNGIAYYMAKQNTVLDKKRSETIYNDFLTKKKKWDEEHIGIN